MRRRLLIILTLIVFVPLVILGWLGAKLVRDEEAVMEHRFSQFMLSQLRAADGEIADVLAGAQRHLYEDLNSLPAAPGELRERARRSPVVSHYFTLDRHGNLVYPSPSDSLSVREADFLIRTREIWERQALTHERDSEGVPQRVATKGSPKSAGKAPASAPSLDGWYSWYWGDGMHLIYWLRDETGEVRGAELDLARLKSDIVVALPDTPSDTPSGEAYTALLDSKGTPIYGWGRYTPKEGEPPRAAMPLAYPLGAWSLAYYVAPERFSGDLSRGLLFNILSGLLFVSAAVIGMAVYFYRESSRDIREAAQRVTFVNQVSHELKTPLTNIRMYAEMLDQELDRADEKPRRHVDILVSESQRLSRLIGNILTFSRKDRQALRLRTECAIVDEVLRKVVDHYRPALEAKDIAVTFQGEASLPVLLDADALEQIAGNLISNVEKYAAEGKCLDVSTTQQGDRVTVLVCDKGPGIAEADREKVFQPFYRVSNRLSDGVSGTGIGLTIARELARLHGGDLVLEPSERGSRFCLTLCCPPAPDGERT